MFFDGGKERKGVSLAGNKKARPNPQETAQKSAAAKLQRELEMKRYKAAVLIQRLYRRHWVIIKMKRETRIAFDDSMISSAFASAPSVAALVTLTRKLCFFYTPEVDGPRLVDLLRFLSVSITDKNNVSSRVELWVNHWQLLRALITSIFSYFLYALSVTSSDNQGAEIVSACLTEILSFDSSAGIIETEKRNIYLGQLKFIYGAHANVFGCTKLMIGCPQANGVATGLQTACGEAVSIFVTFAKRLLISCEAASLIPSEAILLKKVKASVCESLAVSILSAPRAGMSVVSGPILALFAEEGYSEWLKCAARMQALLSSVLCPSADAESLLPEESSQRVLRVLYPRCSTFLKPKKRNIATQKIPSKDKFGKPISFSDEKLVSPEYRSEIVASVLSFMANVSALSVLNDLSVPSNLNAAVQNSNPVLKLLHMWLALANDLLIHQSMCRLPIHVAMYYLDYLSKPTTDIESIPRIQVFDRSRDGSGGSLHFVPESVNGSLHRLSTEAMELDDASIDGNNIASGTKIRKVEPAGRIGGLYIESSIKFLFEKSVDEELGVWNEVYDDGSRYAMLTILRFGSSSVMSTLLHSEVIRSFVVGPTEHDLMPDHKMEALSSNNNAPFSNIQLLVISLLARLIASSDNALPGSKPVVPTDPILSDVMHCAFSYRNAIGKIVSSLAFNNPENPIIKRLWEAYMDFYGSGISLVPQTASTLTRAGFGGPILDKVVSMAQLCHSVSFLYLIYVTLSHQLVALQDDELYAGTKSIDPTKGDLESLIEIIKDSIYHLTWTTPVMLMPYVDAIDSMGSLEFSKESLLANRLDRVAFLQAACRLYNQLSIRNERRGHHLNAVSESSLDASLKVQGGYLPSMKWTWTQARHIGAVRSDFSTENRGLVSSGCADHNMTPSELWDLGDDSHFKFVDSRMQVILLNCPQVINFEQRALVLHSLIETDQRDLGIQSEMAVLSRGDTLRIRRNEILHDAYMSLGTTGGSNMKHKLRVIFVSEDGHEEAGIDGGGLFKEFLESFMKTAFDPAADFFTTTETHELVPTNSSGLNLSPIVLKEKLAYYKFIGKMLAKAVYSEILLEPQFSPVFLNLLLGRTNSIDDMSYLDTQFYKSLMNIKQMILRGENVQHLGLTFQTTSGQDLVPGGQDILVTNANALTYIYLLAKYKLNLSVVASDAFLSGFREIIPVSWLRMFNPREMQSVLGGELRPLDVIDLQRNVTYSGGYHPSQPYIQMFWEVVTELTPQEQGDFLKFITSCSRQPLLGFDKLNPKIGIQEVPARYEGDGPGAAPRLPSAGTCFNLLKLPRYESKDVLIEKLKYAIKCNTGFELS